jgi:anthranilate/para-aminobenzoate synthase component I
MGFRCIARCTTVDAESADIFRTLFGASLNNYWLDSKRSDSVKARFSFMGDDSGPHAFVVSQRVGAPVVMQYKNGTRRSHTGDIFTYFEAALDEYALTDDPPLPFNFRGGYVGYFGYGLMAVTENIVGKTSTLADAHFIFSDRFIAIDHAEDTVYLVAVYEDNVESVNRWFEQVETALRTIQRVAPPPPAALIRPETLEPYLIDGRDEYLAKIAVCQEKISAGESYEICLTSRVRVPLSAERPLDVFNLYLVLRETNPAPYACFMQSPDFSVLCSSPERFLKVDRNGGIEARPIKGTTPRDPNADQDEENRRRLKLDKRYFSENLMIVDLLRNDLARSCVPGSISVPELMEVESYATVHQLVSSIRGTVRDSVMQCVAGCFPGGSMTGAPKHRTLEIIDDIESAPRGVYSGALGYISLNTTVDLNIVIRTIVISDGLAEIGVGGAITHLSDPLDEFEEIKLKALAPFSALFDQINDLLTGT